MKTAVLFVAGRYLKKHLPVYRRLARGKLKVAVDGGLRFFSQARIRPDLLIGDLDSLGSSVASIPPNLNVLQFPNEKDWTDLELAIDYCLEQKFRRIDIVQPSIGEPDHFLANLYLLTRMENGSTDVRLYGPDYEVRRVKNGSVTFNGAVGATLSVIMVSRTIRLNCTGTAYRADSLRVGRGSTLPTRNLITARRATIRVRGEALVICRLAR